MSENLNPAKTPVCQSIDPANSAFCQSGEPSLPVGVAPVAYLTRNDEGEPAMLFFDLQEARTFCDEEEPEPLFLRGLGGEGGGA